MRASTWAFWRYDLLIKGFKGDSKRGEIEGGLKIESFGRWLWFEWDLRSQCLLQKAAGCPLDFLLSAIKISNGRAILSVDPAILLTEAGVQSLTQGVLIR